VGKSRRGLTVKVAVGTISHGGDGYVMFSSVSGRGWVLGCGMCVCSCTGFIVLVEKKSGAHECVYI